MDITIVSYNGKLKYGEEQMFRGAFLKELGDKASLHFHNHTENGLRYSYPLVQYKIADGKPTVVGIGNGTCSVSWGIFCLKSSLIVL